MFLFDDAGPHSIGVLTQVVTNHLRMRMNVDQNLINPELFADLQPDGKQRRATNRNEALRDCLSDGVQTSTMSGGQQECFHSTLPGFVVLGSRFCVIRKRRSKYPEFTRILIAINKWIVD